MPESKFKPITEDTDVTDKDTPEILLKNRAKVCQMLDLVQVWYKESTGRNGPFIGDLAKMIARYTQTQLEVTRVKWENHIYLCNRYLYILVKNCGLPLSNCDNRSRFIGLDSSIDDLFRNGASSITIKPVYSHCNTLKDRFCWSFGLAECSTKQAIDTLLRRVNLSGRTSMRSYLGYPKKYRNRLVDDKINGKIFNMYWFEVKHDIKGRSGVIWDCAPNPGKKKLWRLNHGLSEREATRQFTVSIEKGDKGEIIIDDLCIHVCPLNPRKWYFWCALHSCSCESNKVPTGVVLELCCHY